MSGYTGDQFAVDLLNLILHNANLPLVGDATGLRGSSVAGNLSLALHNADPTAAGDQTSHVTAYTNYARVAITRVAGQWTVSVSYPSPAQAANNNVETFPVCGATGDTLTHASLGVAASGPSKIILAGPLQAPLILNNLGTPYFPAGALVLTQS